MIRFATALLALSALIATPGCDSDDGGIALAPGQLSARVNGGAETTYDNAAFFGTTDDGTEEVLAFTFSTQAEGGQQAEDFTLVLLHVGRTEPAAGSFTIANSETYAQSDLDEVPSGTVLGVLFLSEGSSSATIYLSTGGSYSVERVDGASATGRFSLQAREYDPFSGTTGSETASLSGTFHATFRTEIDPAPGLPGGVSFLK